MNPLVAWPNEVPYLSLQVSSWLKTAEYGREPDHDGSNRKGFRITDCGPQVFQSDSSYQRRCEWDFYSALTVQPTWVEYHK